MPILLSLWLVGFEPAAVLPATFAVTPAGEVVAVSGGRGVFAFAAGGKLRWRFAVMEGQTVLGAPGVAPGGTVFVRTDRELYAITNVGSLYWRRSLPSPALDPDWLRPVPLAGREVVVITGARELTGFSPTGDVLWRYSVPGDDPLSARPETAANGNIYVRTAREVVVLTPSGREAWRTTIVQ